MQPSSSTIVALEKAIAVALQETIDTAAPGNAANVFATAFASRVGVQAPRSPGARAAITDPSAIFLEVKPVLERCMDDVMTSDPNSSEEVILTRFATGVLAAAGVVPELLRLCKAGDVAGAEALLAKRADPNVADGSNETSLFLSAYEGHAEVVRLLLAQPAIHVNQANQNGASPLHIAARKGHAACVELCLAHHAVDVNQAILNGMTPLYIASQLGQAACVTLLLAHPTVNANQANQNGATPLYIAAQNGHVACVTLLLAHPTVNVNLAEQQGISPLFISAANGHLVCLELLLAQPTVNVNQTTDDGFTPLIAAADSRATAAALELVFSGRADLDTRNDDGDSALAIAHRADDAELVAVLVAHGADARPIFEHAAIADAARGHALPVADALRRRVSLQGVADAKLPSLVHDCCMASGGGDDTVAAQRIAAKSEFAATVFEPDRKYFNGLLPPAIFFAVEACTGSVVAALLGLVSGLDDGVAEEIATEATAAAAANDPSADGYVPGARFHAMIIALGERGLFDVRQCKPAKKLAAWYYGSIAGVRFMLEKPGTFDGLKAMAEQRLQKIAEPLDARCEREDLLQRLGGIGSAHADASVALDDDGLLPMPPSIWGFQPGTMVYEPYLICLIRMVSLALDDLFVSMLRAALAPLGDSVETEIIDGKPVIHVLRAGRPLVDIQRAPVKSAARMLNKLGNKDDHKEKPMPRPKWNVDTVREPGCLLAPRLKCTLFSDLLCCLVCRRRCARASSCTRLR